MNDISKDENFILPGDRDINKQKRSLWKKGRIKQFFERKDAVFYGV